jgi:hypothetical protein
MRTANEPTASEPAKELASGPAKPPRPSGTSLGDRIGAWRRRTQRERERWSRRALDWPLVNWLEATVWLLVVATLASSYYGSYGNLVGVLMAVGYAFGPAHVVPVALDAPLTCSVIGQFLLARWKSPATRRWRLFAVTVVTAPLSLAGNALHGALVVPTYGEPYLDLSLLDLARADVWVRLIAAMVPGIGIILAVAVTELVLRERARLEELREAANVSGADDAAEAAVDSHDESQPPEAGLRNGRTKRIDPKALRIARAGGDWNKVAAATGLGEHAAKRALTAARKQIASESPPAIALTPGPEVAA